MTAGSGSISHSGNTTTIEQSSRDLSLTWQNFNIAPQETVDFVQPSALAVAVNRILGNSGTQILGRLNANGQVYLINPNGILFGRDAQVNVAGLVASTLDLNDATLDTAAKTFSGNGSGSGKGSGGVDNLGTINAAAGGYVALLGSHVGNRGAISARLGSVALGAGSAVTLTFDGNRLLHLQVDRSVFRSIAENGGLIQADGGVVIMTAGAKDALVASVVNNTGVIEARTVENHDGTITLLGGMSAGTVNVGGTLDAGAPAGGNGGAIETSAARVEIAANAKITTAAVGGLTGSWLIDPNDFTVAATGGDVSGTALSSSLGSTNVTLQSSTGGTAGSGNVNVNDAVSWSANTTLTLTASNNVNVNAGISATGTGAGIAINPNTANGLETASGTGTFKLGAGAAIDLPNVSASSSTALIIGGTSYRVLNSLGVAGSTTGTDLQGINGNLAGHFALGSNIDASATSSWNGGSGFAPLGASSTPFTGVFNGLGHTIGNLAINRPTNDVGLFAYTSSSGVIGNVGLLGGSITGGAYDVGGLVGRNYGTVDGSYVTASVRGTSNSIGGLAGANYGVISNSHATGDVGSANNVGGLVGLNDKGGTINNSYATGAVSGWYDIGGLVGFFHTGSGSGLYATGAVNGIANIGGLVGQNNATVSNTYATGRVHGSGASDGGLVGNNYGTINRSYAIGAVSGSSGVGGLVGNGGGPVNNSFWDIATSGRATSHGGTGLTTAQMQTAANFSGFTFTTTPGATGNNWVMVDGDGTLNNAAAAPGAVFPMLAFEYATTITNAHQLQLAAMNLSAAYTLANTVDASATGAGTDVWGSAGFVPIGGAAAGFTGSFDGLGHTIGNLTINLPSANDVGLIGYAANGSVIRNVGLIAETVSGASSVGGLAGWNFGSVADSFSTGTVNGSGSQVGALIGYNTGAVNNSYSTGNVSGVDSVGGLVGYNFGGSISDSYAAGSVQGSSFVGGLTGRSSGTVTASFWDIVTTGQATSAGARGMSTAQMQQQADFTSATGANGNVNPAWDSAGTWVIYDGHTYPLLQRFMAPLTITAGSDSKTYDGTAYSGGTGVAYSSMPDGRLLGTLGYSGTSQGAINAGSYAITPSGLYSDQQGYVITMVNGTLTVDPRPANLIGSRVYDGTTTVASSAFTVGNLLAGQTLSLSGSGSVTSANVSAGTQAVTVGTLGLGDGSGGGLAANYTFSGGVQTAVITSAPLTVSGTSAANKIYDGTRVATLTGGTLSGAIAGDMVSLNQSGTFSSKNAADGIVVTATDTLSGALGNYTLIEPTGLNANITPAFLTVAGTSVANKVYDGTRVATLTGGSLSGVIAGDSVSLNQSGTFNSKNAANGIAVTATDTLSGAFGNYTLVEPTGLNADITPAKLIYTAAIVSGFVGQDPNLSGMVDGFVPGDTLTSSTAGSLTWTIAGNPTKPGRYAIDGGGLSAGNYTFAQAIGNTTALTLTMAPPPPQPVIDATAQLESDVLSAREAIAVDAASAFAGTMTLHVVSGGVKLPSDAVNLD